MGSGLGWVREVRTIKLQRELVIGNGALASRTRRLLHELGVAMINVVGASGAGKTSLIEATVRRLRRERIPVLALVGDASDARRIEEAGAPARPIASGSGCHLDAGVVADALSDASPEPGTLVLVENVGNLVCSALFDVGEHAKVVVMSVGQSEEEPLKRSALFRAADALVLGKADLLRHVEFDVERCFANARRVNPCLPCRRVSARDGTGVEEWCGWARRQLPRAE